MIEIDGSFGEGGGQIVRTAVALSAVTGKPVQIKQIRQGRPKSGLAPQHACAISALSDLCDAKTSGVTPGSSEITFVPGEIHSGLYKVDIGTAGSVTLLMQCLLPALFKADGPSTLEVQGGTDVEWAPTVDYFRNVFLPALECFGAKVNLEVRQRGYYPKGRGCVLLYVEPAKLNACHFKCQKSGTVLGLSHSSNLPMHVARKQADSAIQALKEAGYEAQIDIETLKLPSIGSGITIWSGWKGASSLGKRSLPAEKVGKKAAEELILELKSCAAVDVHLADQLIPYIALAGGSIVAREISLHAKTNIWTARHFLDANIKIIGDQGEFKIGNISPR
jgi:RNA 3'-terminal phosphate cyclase (ATP)